MRGALEPFPAICPVHGIIPAYAGSTCGARCTPISCGDHPRICGEHKSTTSSLSGIGGSSPHMRGAQSLYGMYVIGKGIIPAYAGSTGSICRKESMNEDHPRICGEHDYNGRDDFWAKGSSPHMRGAPIWNECVKFLGRIIPAYAGSTDERDYAILQSTDHPRICGEHT